MADDGPLYEHLRPNDERAALLTFLDVYRAEVATKAATVCDDVARARLLPATDMTIAGIVKHLAWSEDSWFTGKILGQPFPEPWASAPLLDEPDWPFHSAVDDTLSSLLDLYAASCDRSRVAVSQCESLDDLALRPALVRRELVNVRWLLIHMIDETARHAGHLDLLLDAATAVR